MPFSDTPICYLKVLKPQCFFGTTATYTVYIDTYSKVFMYVIYSLLYTCYSGKYKNLVHMKIKWIRMYTYLCISYSVYTLYIYIVCIYIYIIIHVVYINIHIVYIYIYTIYIYNIYIVCIYCIYIYTYIVYTVCIYIIYIYTYIYVYRLIHSHPSTSAGHRTSAAWSPGGSGCRSSSFSRGLDQRVGFHHEQIGLNH